MTASTRMTQRTVIERLVDPAPPGDVDDWGNTIPAASVWTVVTSAVPIWVWSSIKREATGPESTTVVDDLRGIVARALDIRESDRLNGVTDRRGNVVRAGAILIEAVIDRRDHKELVLRSIG